ncbi:periplasmic binding protein-like II [Rhizoclosmatium globosum]|uniref:Periplasmic binding protein-like II n=1 Tax=Rhizoclosmatium globosum TaxID=329046 RepID=A0A1Y2BFF7_9FUNG|nr:periplasmic binding protein-like II [Rhizoclosmatium globosum]|eukprot:ORY33551.1 periplasmic binding protein-like II [Rhizoclosmatium globosum]
MTSSSLVVLSILLCRVVLATNHQVANIKGGGSTFSLQPYSSASLDFGQMYQGFQVTPYDPSNSLTGQQNVASGKFNWGGSDVSITPDLANQGLVVLPAVAGGLLITYNIPNIPTPLKLSRTILPRIFDGTIFMWKDPRIVKDNPFLANYAGRIRIIRQSTSSGATINLRTFLTQLDTANNTLLAKSPSAAVIMIGAIPNTITYLNQYDAHDITTGSDSTVGSAWLEHKDGSYIAWSIKSVKAAIDGISPAIVQNLSNNCHLKFLWLFLITPSYATRYDFVSLYNTPIGLRTLNYLKTITYPDSSTPVYGQSICDADVDGTYKNPCVHGTCSDPYPFQEETEVCICEFGYQNVNKNDCSEPTPIFMPGIERARCKSNVAILLSLHIGRMLLVCHANVIFHQLLLA